jgi:hypothetical protein
MLNAARIAERKNRPAKIVEKEICGENFRCRVLKLSERDDFQLGMLDKTGKPDIANLRGGKARLIALCLVNEEGSRLCSAQDVEDAFDPTEIDEVHEWVQTVNGMQPKVNEEAAGNS